MLMVSFIHVVVLLAIAWLPDTYAADILQPDATAGMGTGWQQDPYFAEARFSQVRPSRHGHVSPKKSTRDDDDDDDYDDDDDNFPAFQPFTAYNPMGYAGYPQAAAGMAPMGANPQAAAAAAAYYQQQWQREHQAYLEQKQKAEALARKQKQGGSKATPAKTSSGSSITPITKTTVKPTVAPTKAPTPTPAPTKAPTPSHVTPIVPRTQHRSFDNGYVNPVLKCIFMNCSSPYLRCISNAGCSDVFQCLQSDVPMPRCVKFHDSLERESKDIFKELGGCEEEFQCFTRGPQTNHSDAHHTHWAHHYNGTKEHPADWHHKTANAHHHPTTPQHKSGKGGGSSSKAANNTKATAAAGHNKKNTKGHATQHRKRTPIPIAKPNQPPPGSKVVNGSLAPHAKDFHHASCDVLCDKQCDLDAQIGGATDPHSCRLACAIACFKARYIISL